MKYIVFVLFTVVVCVMGGLDPDNPSHRDFSNRMDEKFGDNGAYNKFARPLIHGSYHTGRFVNSGNAEEWARAKDQFGKFGTGQPHSDYLNEQRHGHGNAGDGHHGHGGGDMGGHGHGHGGGGGAHRGAHHMHRKQH